MTPYQPYPKRRRAYVRGLSLLRRWRLIRRRTFAALLRTVMGAHREDCP